MPLRRSFGFVAWTLAVAAAAGCGESAAARGQRLYAGRGCAVCHGANGAGDGPSAARLNVRPRDFADVAGYRFGSSQDAVASTIRAGAGAMPAFRDISESEAREIAAWIATLSQGIVVTDAWVRASTATRPVSSAYFTIENQSGTAVRLTAVAAPDAGQLAIHATAGQNGQTGMRAVGSVSIPAGGTVALAPGGMHVMITGISRPLEPGATVPLTLTFDGQRRRTIAAVVRPFDAVSAR